MTESSIYQRVKAKLITHGVEKTKGGRLVLSDQRLFSLFVALERAMRSNSFDAVQLATNEIDCYLASLGKRQLMAFAYLYVRFSDFTPRATLADEHLPDGKVRKCATYATNVTNEQILIGLWARVKYDEVGERLLRAVYAEG